VGLTPTKKDTPTFLKGMHHRALMMSRMIMPLLQIGESSKVLDIAAGAGSWSWLLQQKNKGSSYTLLEQPELAPDMSTFIEQCGLTNFETLAQDYHQLEKNPIHDDVLYFGALHQEPMDTLFSVIETCFAQVAPGGTLWILDIFATGDDKEDLFSWLFGLNMLLTTDGSVFELAEVESAIQKLEHVEAHSAHRVPTDLPYHLFEIKKSKA
jgi:cyclopropane fatty-acyl-phospholipid synthase-like methyltransferase